jgi:phosphomannomutase / phosphoglucomutase
MKLDPKIFRAYDIRGEAFVDFDEDGFLLIAQAFAQYITQKFPPKDGKSRPRIFVSGDGRISMPELYPAILTGLTEGGADPTWGGTLPTPINYFAMHEGDFDASIQISASHNPADDNGLKLTDRDGAVCGAEIQKIYAMTQCLECHRSLAVGVCESACEKVDFAPSYREKIIGMFGQKSKPLRLVIDAGNGVSGMFYPLIYRQMGHEVIELFCDLDGSFPNHQPDPERPENLKAAQEKVLETKADMGLVFDGDGDRVGIILSDGTILNADKILYILTADFLSRHPGEKIIVDAMTSATLIEKIKTLGGHPILSQTGHSFIETVMHEHQARLGGEQSGHFMFGENFYGHDDACLAGLKFIQAISENPIWIKEITENWPNLVEFSEKISVPDSIKFEVLSKAIEKIEAGLSGKNIKINTIDGLRLDWGDGEWAIIRASNTSPKIAIRIEARDKKKQKEKQDLIIPMLKTTIESFV